jgi:hypothetical protein
MGDPCPIVYPHRHASGGQRIDATRASARRRLVGDHPNVNAALFRPDQRPTMPEPTHTHYGIHCLID